MNVYIVNDYNNTYKGFSPAVFTNIKQAQKELKRRWENLDDKKYIRDGKIEHNVLKYHVRGTSVYCTMRIDKVEFSTYKETDVNIQDKVNAIIKNNHLPAENVKVNNGIVDIRIYGDWKNDHFRLDDVMRENGFLFMSDDCVESDDFSCYTSTHHYKKIA